MNAPAESLRLADFDQPSALIYGIGNIGRQDDGLGWAFIDWLEEQGLCPQADLMRHYQLQLEDAELISHKERVLFVDASVEAGLESFELRRVEPRLDYSFTSHAISIASIVATCRTCFGRTPEVYVLAIRGYEWELQTGLSAPALLNLQAAQHHLQPACATEST
ncbi:Ni,Fe-hydrogenase maturation factor [Serpentinimonas raichei]|jgi:hydrogenase maturation protease|uniref:Ni,Fe-hydrogenase maturation factor n=1 Tax=Serpentinimonas raichei TaxID=1458425 RepID=A0A060NGT3_9BURK|nr:MULTISPECIES: hydrogenase maturation protease [Comamonadaceae]MDO8276449.1 hydrogenase maturation protease [Serpentinimonas sp.]MDO9603362.1 hydrogenase maturation protease [Hydrogenophaga sp.]BAO80991.1 Ni,Fe-hydrogenase maturation factor [Serpentinimonas raichei]